MSRKGVTWKHRAHTDKYGEAWTGKCGDMPGMWKEKKKSGSMGIHMNICEFMGIPGDSWGYMGIQCMEMDGHARHRIQPALAHAEK